MATAIRQDACSNGVRGGRELWQPEVDNVSSSVPQMCMLREIGRDARQQAKAILGEDTKKEQRWKEQKKWPPLFDNQTPLTSLVWCHFETFSRLRSHGTLAHNIPTTNKFKPLGSLWGLLKCNIGCLQIMPCGLVTFLNDAHEGDCTSRLNKVTQALPYFSYPAFWVTKWIKIFMKTNRQWHKEKYWGCYEK